MSKTIERELRHVTKISDLSPKEVLHILETAKDFKKNPEKYSDYLKQKTLLMLFAKPSLRTRVSFETVMTKLNGHAIMYSITDSPLGKKETYGDTARCLSRYVDVIMARVFSRDEIQKLSVNSSIPVINALDDFGHPCQILADLQTILEKKGSFEGLKMAYVGDCRNNVTYGLMRGCALVGMEIRVSGPSGEEFKIEQEVLDECEEICKKTGGVVKVVADPVEAVKGVDVIYNDSWMSYHIPKEEREERLKKFMPWQVNSKLMSHAKEDCIFMNCLPATRGDEVTAEIIDGPQSVVFDEAENRMWAQGSLLMWLLGKI
ncbi:ornithine carbamoyltransferase [Anaeramoeba flamelloides]|uniref:ornithine carbamoyltransferase n=1 Tax=Anaeramoeba flamelloides TaxID=1746091 RepID=A0AAV8A1I5_9EUKA|nr:ornithine carbamoyltransferase [Anaeramoeba flamelloides]